MLTDDGAGGNQTVPPYQSLCPSSTPDSQCSVRPSTSICPSNARPNPTAPLARCKVQGANAHKTRVSQPNTTLHSRCGLLVCVSADLDPHLLPLTKCCAYTPQVPETKQVPDVLV